MSRGYLYQEYPIGVKKKVQVCQVVSGFIMKSRVVSISQEISRVMSSYVQVKKLVMPRNTSYVKMSRSHLE